jgi:hypothetical protein
MYCILSLYDNIDFEYIFTILPLDQCRSNHLSEIPLRGIFYWIKSILDFNYYKIVIIVLTNIEKV